LVLNLLEFFLIFKIVGWLVLNLRWLKLRDGLLLLSLDLPQLHLLEISVDLLNFLPLSDVSIFTDFFSQPSVWLIGYSTFPLIIVVVLDLFLRRLRDLLSPRGTRLPLHAHSLLIEFTFVDVALLCLFVLERRRYRTRG